MPKDVIMPALGMAQETGTLLRWLKAPGEKVAKGDLLMEVETDKANVEIEAPASGILADVRAQPGDVVPVGQVIAQIVTEGETAPARGSAHLGMEAKAKAPERPAEPKGATEQSDTPERVSAQGNGGKGIGRAEKVLATPKARRLATERKIDLKTLRGTGPRGAVLAADVLQAEGLPVAATPQVAPEMVTAERAPATGTISVSNLWRVMVERLSAAWTTIPHFYLMREVNATRLIAWRDAMRKKHEHITYTDLLVKVVAAVLLQHPRANAQYQNNTIVLNRVINIGLAVAIEQGLTVPVIHQANELSLHEISERRRALMERAHAGKLSLADLRDGTFTISNLGMYGVDAFNAIVNPPQAAILAVSRIAERVVPVNHQPGVQPMLTLTLSCDHRVLDGARGAQFLDALAQTIEEPLILFD